jgi:pyridoxamine 5'-phosphate oxidase
MLDKNKEPFLLFDEWFDLAQLKELNDPNAMNLATVSEDNKPHSRMVLLKGHSDKGFIFYTNTNSNKGLQISFNDNVALCFHWKSLQRQIRIEGTVNKVEDSIADDYFNSRGYMKKFPDKNNVPRPAYWTGFLVSPNKIEFWQDMPHRIHDRLVFEKQENHTWISRKLYP